MNKPAETTIEPSGIAPTLPADYSKMRLLYWSVRRELWENRSIYLAPLTVAAVMLVGFLLGARRLAEVTRATEVLGRGDGVDLLEKPLSVAAIPIVIAASIVALFYCLDALHGERQDRSILFWKSLPVSDFLTVLSKALVPFVVMPAVTCLTAIVLQLLLLLVGTAFIVAAGVDGTVLWTGLSLFHQWGVLVYGVVGLALWYAPIYGWLLLVSGWAKRSTFLWAVLPPLALCLVEKIAFDTVGLWSLLKDRLFGFVVHGFDVAGHGQAVPDPVALLTSPGLWAGLVVAVILLGTAVWFRRYRQPI